MWRWPDAYCTHDTLNSEAKDVRYLSDLAPPMSIYQLLSPSCRLGYLPSWQAWKFTAEEERTMKVCAALAAPAAQTQPQR